MMSSNFIVDVSEHDFEYEVLSYSLNTPVVVEFWATWCKPCKLLGPMLERFAETAQGKFRLARVDVDANPGLAMRYGVRSIPAVKAISHGQVVAEFSGLLPEPQVHEFLDRLGPPSEASLALEKANSLLANNDWAGAEALYRELEEQSPEQPNILLGLTKAVLAQGKGTEAIILLNYFPASREYLAAQSLRPLAEAMNMLEQQTLPAETDLDMMFQNSIRLAQRGNHLSALDGLLDILRLNKRYRNDQARQVFLAILEILGPDHSDARQYRAELATVLF